MPNDLTTTESQRLTTLESTIERGRQSFVEVGTALIEIRESKLYRQQSETFEGYCQTRWQFSRRHANRLMEAADVIAELSAGTEKQDPWVLSERVAREVAQAPKGERAAAVRDAVATAPKDKKTGKPKVTAKHVERVVAKRKDAEPKPPAPPDSPFAPDDREPWLAYNASLDEAIATLDGALAKIQAVADAANQQLNTFSGWYVANEYLKLFRNIRTTWQNHRVAGWASERFKRDNGGRVFVYEFEAKKKGALAA